jgi:hypothetical protein
VEEVNEHVMNGEDACADANLSRFFRWSGLSFLEDNSVIDQLFDLGGFLEFFVMIGVPLSSSKFGSLSSL